MSKQYLLGIDIGTYEAKGAIVTLDGRLISAHAIAHRLTIPRQGWAEHDPEAVWWSGLVSLVQWLLTDSGIHPDEILSVGTSAIGPDLLPVDVQMRPLRSGAILYGIDTRATAEIETLQERIGNETLLRKCGNLLSSQAVGPKILWLAKHEPQIYTNAARFVTATTFLVARLTGRCVMDHLTASTWVPLYDFASHDWGELCQGIVEVERLPELAWSTDIAGTVTREAARQTGLAEGTPVIVGTADAAAEAVSVGVVTPGQMMLMYGSTVFLYSVQAEPKTDCRLWALPYVARGTSSLAAGMATSGAILRWFRDQLAPDLALAEQATGANAYEALMLAAAKIPAGADGLVVLPYFSGERTPVNDPRAKGAIFGLTLAHSRAHLYRAVLEGIAHGIKHHLDVMKTIDAKPEQVVAVGGGTKNRLWLQVVSDVCRLSQTLPAVTLGACYGDAFMAGVGVGAFSSILDIGRWICSVDTIEPNPTNAACYRKHHEVYLELYQRNKDLMHLLWDEHDHS